MSGVWSIFTNLAIHFLKRFFWNGRLNFNHKRFFKDVYKENRRPLGRSVYVVKPNKIFMDKFNAAKTSTSKIVFFPEQNTFPLSEVGN